MQQGLPGWSAPRAARARNAIAWLVAGLVLAHGGLADADDDLPGRVGRLAEAAGGVLVASEYAGNEWLEAGINHPITTGDSLWSPVGGRAEVDYGGGQFRLAAATHVQVARLDDRELVLYVGEGALVVRVRFLDPADVVTVDAPTAQIRIVRPGLYRVDVLPDRQITLVTVRDGEAVVALAAAEIQALPGQTVTIAGQDPAVAELRNGVSVDSFDAWSADRDRYYERGRSAGYVSREMVGAAELDEYGTWQTYPDYGAVWFPNSVPVDWAPYRDGYWLAVGAWGPTWVDAAPWGYAPFHYGRWAWFGGRWGWCPGGYVGRPRWAPALVAWVGGPGWNVAASGGMPVYAWVPLGWRDPYLPPWRGCSARCRARFNDPYGAAEREPRRTIPARWENQRVPGALTAVPAGALAGGRPIARDHLRLPPESAATAPALAAAPTLVSGRSGRQPPVTSSVGASVGTRLPPTPASTWRATRPGGYPGSASERSPSPASPSVAPLPARATTGGTPAPTPAATPVPPRQATVPAVPRTVTAPAVAPAVPTTPAVQAPATRAAPVRPAPTARPERGLPVPSGATSASVPAPRSGATPPMPPMPQVVAPSRGMPAPPVEAPAPAAPGQAPGRPGPVVREAPAGGVAPPTPLAPGPGTSIAPGAPARR